MIHSCHCERSPVPSGTGRSEAISKNKSGLTPEIASSQAAPDPRNDICVFSMMRIKFWLLATGYWLLVTFLTLYSYSQIDLNLTLSSNLVYQSFQREMIYLGYFNRPLSTFVYLTLIFLLFTFYFLLLILSKKREITVRQVWFLILGNFVILLFAYPAFSHDIFNYIFDARILLHHQANPWAHTALDFPQDLWTRFMHWTHRTYPYGPVWLLVTIFPYFLGFGKFVLTLFNFKLFFALSYLGSCYLIYRIVSKISHFPVILSSSEGSPRGFFGLRSQNDEREMNLFALAFFAFNPLILIESLISPHLDIFMTFLGMLAIFLILNKRKFLGFLFFVFSVGVKYTTFGYLPLLLGKKKNKILVAIFLTFVAIVVQIGLREVLPWYFIPLIALVSLSGNYFLCLLFLGLSLGGMLYYTPYLYIGEYNELLKSWRLYLFFAPILASVISYFAISIFRKEK